MSLLLSHPTGSQFVRQALRAFHDAGALSEFWTTIARPREALSDLVLPARIRNELRRRSYDPDILAKTHTLFSPEVVRLIAQRFRGSRLTEHETGPFCFDSVARRLDLKVASRVRKGGIAAIYGYEDCALDSFRAANQVGTTRVYELPIGHWRLARRIFAEEAQAQPEWAATLEGLSDSESKLARKDKEAQLAQVIVVPSRFVADSLKDCPGVSAPVRVVNYGCPMPVDDVEPRPNGALRVLFVGSLGARKGVPYLLDAVRGLDVELTLVGPMPAAACGPLEQAVRTHRYLGSVPHDRVLCEMRAHDVFVFPTLFEGLANVLLEALSQGLVPVTTPNSGAAGLIEDGADGFVVPIRSASEVSARLQTLIDNRDRLYEMKRAALAKAAQHTWDRYRANLIAAVAPALEDV